MEAVQHNGSLATHLRRIRETRGFTQSALAARAGMTRDYIASLEGGRIRNPGVEALYSIAEVLGVTMEAIMGRSALTMAPALAHDGDDYTFMDAQAELEARLRLVGAKPFEPMTPAQVDAYTPDGVDVRSLLEAATLAASKFVALSMEVPADWAAVSFYSAGAYAMALVMANSRRK